MTSSKKGTEWLTAEIQQAEKLLKNKDISKSEKLELRKYLVRLKDHLAQVVGVKVNKEK